MAHYKSNVRDLEFNLFEILHLEKVLGAGTFADFDREVVSDILREVSRLAEGPVAESFEDADRAPTTFDVETSSVVIPKSLAEVVRTVKESGWAELGLPADMGGSSAPAVVVWAVNEMLSSANAPLTFFNFSAVIAQVMFEFGTEQQQHWAKAGLERGWSGTMVLTEPDAGSDVGAGRTKAVAQPDGTWHIEGVKRFITNGDVGDTAENVFHLVLARPEGAGPGTKGLSLFYVPKWRFDPVTLDLGERNGVFVTGVEKKMGIKSSPTCELTFGGTNIPAVGWLVGEVHDGIAQMFKVIENARMTVGTKAIGTLSTGYLNALDYARERVQGTDLTEMRNPTAHRVTIDHHPAVRHSLALQKAYAEGLRAVYLYTAAHQDPEIAATVSGADPDVARRVNDLLLPVVKGVGSERACEMLTRGLQVFGGSGFLQDYPLEQYLRDSIIDTLYEGTTPIQAQDFLFRKILRDKKVAFSHVANEIERFVNDRPGEPSRERILLKSALDDICVMIDAFERYVEGSTDAREIYKAGLGACRLLDAVGDLLVGWRLLVQAEVASSALAGDPTGPDASFYRGKVATASYFVRTVLPRTAVTKQSVLDLELEIMDLDAAAF
ncbi:acyl-CoA dehydrogenase (plasmid) [Rhodococcus pyridinivorans]|uniref:acyl-CoA dehydrogenase n=1 Tax=Rhodococcus pyridinivorans TaxID=103816 RepID=UPI0020C5F1DE|nr:acyl-CoA dehydrogenase [Rhodococcus pyridinivorans]UTM39795.1 acyl-CoA dehydrogenase [Rhodococcus pyridinivorans]